jgi:hypothetical protein
MAGARSRDVLRAAMAFRPAGRRRGSGCTFQPRNALLEDGDLAHLQDAVDRLEQPAASAGAISPAAILAGICTQASAASAALPSAGSSSKMLRRPARFPGRAHFVSFNFAKAMICRVVSSRP